jgi:nifR3 family TIM-barrel protein
MSRNFWQKLKKPIIALAPMANVTDAAFRRIIAQTSKPDVFWTEFVSVEALLSQGKEHALIDLWFTEAEHPIVAQIFGAKPEQFEEVAKLITKLGFDGIDINMGCPDRGVEKQGAGAALIKNPKLAKEIIQATKRGAGGLPVSVKTRIGYNKQEIDTWIPALLEENLAALTVHLRTRKEMSDVPAHWEVANHIVQLRDKIAPQTLILGNGDIKTLDEAHAIVQKTSIDGVMIGRGIFGNPWVFLHYVPTVQEKLSRMVEHTKLFEQLFKSNRTRNEQLKDFAIMRKHYKAYASGFEGAGELRVRLMEAENSETVQKIVAEFLQIQVQS